MASIDKPSQLPERRRRAVCQREMLQASPWKARFRNFARKWAGKVLSWGARLPSRDDWIFFPYYHFVFDDERRNFARQLKAMKSLGDFMSLDDAVRALSGSEPIQGRYFCLTFDDGFKNWYTNALPILLDHRCPAAFFLTTDYIGLDLDTDWERLVPFYQHSSTYRLPVDFLDWDECRELRNAGMTLGSHTCTHNSLMKLSLAEVDRELRESKRILEEQLGQACLHFCAPYGVPGVSFDPKLHTQLATKIGYRSFLSTAYGYNRVGDNLPYVRRRYMGAGDDPAIFRYALNQCRTR